MLCPKKYEQYRNGFIIFDFKQKYLMQEFQPIKFLVITKRSEN